MDIEEQQQVLQDFLVELAASFGLSATATSQVDENQLTVDLHGDGLGLLVGPPWPPSMRSRDRPQHPAAASGRPEYAKVVVDVEGIRQRRRESLSAFVTDAAQQVVDEDVRSSSRSCPAWTASRCTTWPDRSTA